MVSWSQTRFDEVCATLNPFLKKQAGFRLLHFVPVSGLHGINLTETVPMDHMLQWYKGSCLIQTIGRLPLILYYYSEKFHFFLVFPIYTW